MQGRYKFVRYSGKERDATGLYYYGYRYYQPWLGRWLSADPAGTVDGLNLFAMVRNNPMTLVDEHGLRGGKKKGGAGGSGVQAAPTASESDGAGNEPAASATASTSTGSGSDVGHPGATSSRSEQPGADGLDDDGWSQAPSSKKKQGSKAEKGKDKGAASVREFGRFDSPIYNRLKPRLPTNRQASGDSIVAIGQRPNPTTGKQEVVFLEEGVNKEGLRHITAEHRSHFKNAGIETRAEIIEAVMTALVHGEIVGIQGAQVGRAGRPIYEFNFKGKTQLLAVQLKDDNSVLGANPKEKGVSNREKQAWAQTRKQ